MKEYPSLNISCRSLLSGKIQVSTLCVYCVFIVLLPFCVSLVCFSQIRDILKMKMCGLSIKFDVNSNTEKNVINQELQETACSRPINIYSCI